MLLTTCIIQFDRMAKKAKGSVDGDQPKKDTVKWTEMMDVMLIEALLEQQIIGNRVNGTVTTTAYNNVLQICQEELNYPFDKDRLKNRIKTLKINFNACHDLSKGLRVGLLGVQLQRCSKRNLKFGTVTPQPST